MLCAHSQGGPEGRAGAAAGNIIFLDIDGVLCTPLSLRLNRLLRLPIDRQRFDPLALFWLRRLVRRSGAEIILSSSWRDGLTTDDPFCRSIIENLYARLAANGTPIAGAAPLLPTGDKGGEIALWLRHNPCRQYVILDDHDCFASCPEVRTHWVPVPDSRGLRRREAGAALRFLK